MDFSGLQDQARSRTLRLIMLYVVLMVFLCLVASLLVELVLFCLYVGAENFSPRLFWIYLTHYVPTWRFLAVLAGVPAVVWILSLFSGVRSGGGGKGVAESLGAIPLQPQTGNPAERRLLNVVEEMALASGMPVPPVYVLEEPGINAFAAGNSVDDAVIGVTRGALVHLNREELQSVIGHEFSHIFNGDMRLNLRFAALIFGTMALSQCGSVALRGLARASGGSNRSRNSKNNGGAVLLALMAIALIVYLFGLLSSFIGSILQAAINRQREFLADASSVQYTRSAAMASALKKIGGLAEGSALTSTENIKSVKHFFFSSAADSFFATHPPLTERIRRIDPRWDGTYPTLVTPVAVEEALGEEKGKTALPSGLKTALDLAAPAFVAASPWQRAKRREIRETHGVLDAPFVSSGPSASNEETLEILCQNAREPLDACLMVLALFLHDEPDLKKKQLGLCQNVQNAEMIGYYRMLWREVAEPDRLAMVERAIPTLKTLSGEQFQTLFERMVDFILADGEVSFSEWILCQMIVSQAGGQYHLELPDALKGEGEAPVYGRIEACCNLLWAVASLDADRTRAEEAYAKALDVLGVAPAPPPQKLGLADLWASMRTLRDSSRTTQHDFLKAADTVIQHDGVVDPGEKMFLAMVAFCLGIPLGTARDLRVPDTATPL